MSIWKKISLILLIMLMCSTAIAEPLTVKYQHKTVIIDNPVIDSILTDDSIKRIVRQGQSAIRGKDYKRLVLLATEALKICVSKLLQ